jgi:hypothetical protein
MKDELSHYILICTDGVDFSGKCVPAEQIAVSRLRQHQWPLFRSTAHATRIQAGDRCLVYVAGNRANAQSIVGHALVRKVRECDKTWQEPIRNLIGQPAFWIAEFGMAEIWDAALSIRDYIDRLDFIKNKGRWGLHMIGGVKRISPADFSLLAPDAEKV